MIDIKKKLVTLTAFGLLALTSSCNDKQEEKQSAATPEEEMVKCYGIAQKGKNDCGRADGKHGCDGEATVDNDPCEWVLAKKSECESKNGTISPEKCPGAKTDVAN
jgi:uncharacterized membrane protein